jgi:hypothetical protein
VDTAAEPQVVYDIGGQRWMKDAPGFADAIVWAHEERLRPRCLCRPDADGQGIEMYVARLLDGYIVKRMPNTGSAHATDCPSYEPPTEFSGLGQLLGSAIVENPTTGKTTLKLDFPMSKWRGRSASPLAASASSSSSVATQGPKLSLRALLHYLWDQAELTHWKPGFGGRRSWFTVRKHLLRAAENKFMRGHSLTASLYIPEVFSVDQRVALHLRRAQQWARASHQEGSPQQLMLMIAEVKEITPTRFGHKAVIKHIPEQAFMLDEQLYRRMGRRFESELALWGASEDIHMVIIATFRVAAAGIPTIVELSLMTVTRCWLPVEDGFEKQLIDRLLAAGRSFVKGLRYNLGVEDTLASATLTDCEGSAPVLFVIAGSADNSRHILPVCSPLTPIWRWRPSNEAMPALPRPAACDPLTGVSNSNTRSTPMLRHTRPAPNFHRPL